MAKPSILSIQSETNRFVLERLAAAGAVSFPEIREHITAKFPGAAFNWMTAVRAPMQGLINGGAMKRTADVTVEVYERV